MSTYVGDIFKPFECLCGGFEVICNFCIHFSRFHGNKYALSLVKISLKLKFFWIVNVDTFVRRKICLCEN